MVDAMIQRGEKLVLSPAEEDFLLNDSNDVAKDNKEDSSKSKPSKTMTRSTSKSTPRVSGKSVNKGKQNEPSTSKDSNNNEQMMGMLKQIMSEQNKTNAQVQMMNKRIYDLYEEPEGYDQDDLDYDENQYDEVDEVHDDVHNEDQNEHNEGPSTSKKQRIDDTRFSSLNKRFRSGEKCDLPVNDNLAETVTDVFRNGISEKRYRELLKDEKMAKPENCEGLVTVHTNQVIWDKLYPVTRTNDNKLKNLQTIIIKGAPALTKVINKLDNICEKNNVDGLSQTIDDAMDALAFFGHANHELCLTRRELMKPDADEQYAHLFNKSVPFDKMLFGQDVSKTVTCINLCNKITRKIKRGGPKPWWWHSRGHGRGRGTGRGRSSGGRGSTKSTNSKKLRQMEF